MRGFGFPQMAALLTVRARRPGASKATLPPPPPRGKIQLRKSSEGLPHVVPAERPELVLGVGHVPPTKAKQMPGIELVH